MAASRAKQPVEADRSALNPRALIGQDRAWDQLCTLYPSGDGPTGLILYGPEGIGKRTAALVLAKTLLAGQAPQVGQPVVGPDQDRAARMVEAGGHPDLLFLEKLADKTELTVAVVRRIGGFFSISSIAIICIIHEAKTSLVAIIHILIICTISVCNIIKI